MQQYIDRKGDEAISAYEVGEDYIDVRFSSGARYRYTITSAGAAHIAHMIKLAHSGDGLHAYIDRHVRKLYSARA